MILNLRSINIFIGEFKSNFKRPSMQRLQSPIPNFTLLKLRKIKKELYLNVFNFENRLFLNVAP